MSRRTRGPAHQNAFAFRHNPKSKKTERILGLPNEGLCQRCHDKVEWRKKYRKYKPLTAPSHCNSCRQRTVLAAYHTYCQKCAKEKGVCAWCNEKRAIVGDKGDSGPGRIEEERAELEKQLEGLHLRKKRTILRQFDRSNGLVKPSQEDIAKAAADDDDDEFGDEFDDDDEFGDDYDDDDDDDNDDDDLCSDEDPLERALWRKEADERRGGLGLLKEHHDLPGGGGEAASAVEQEGGGKASGVTQKVSAGDYGDDDEDDDNEEEEEEEEEESEDDEDEDEEEDGGKSR